MSETPELEPTVRITAPATSANLGPGFDCLALALDLQNEIDVTAGDFRQPVTVTVEGEGTDSLARDGENLVFRAMRRLADEAGRGLPPCAIRLRNNVPLGRGLGSSAAAIVGGLVAGAALLDLSPDPSVLLPIALQLESHPDNVAAALWGGCTIGVLDGDTAVVHRLEPPVGLTAVVLIPEGFSDTLESRATLPGMVRRADAVYNAGRCALLVAGLASGRFDLLRTAMQDRLHQPQRGAAFSYLHAAIKAALDAGAHGASLSGAGSSVVALVTQHAEAVAAALERVALDYGLPARTLILQPVALGAHIL